MVFLVGSRSLGLHVQKSTLRPATQTLFRQNPLSCINTRDFHSSFFSAINPPNSVVRKSPLLKSISSSGSRPFFSSTPLARGSKSAQRKQHAKTKHQNKQTQHTQYEHQPIDPTPTIKYRKPRSSYPLAITIAVGCTFVTLSYNRSPFVDFPLPNFIPKLTPEYFDRNFVLSQQNIDEGRVHTLITHSFMHQTYYHLFANMYCMLAVAPLVNPLTFVTIWAGAGVTCSLASLYIWKHGLPFNQNKSSINSIARGCGASGSLSGLITMLAVKHPNVSWQFMFVPIGIPAWFLVGGGAVYSILALNNGWHPGVGHAGHLGGSAFGVLAGVVSRRFGLRGF
ncbi:hypothetical protein EAF00_009186 [Botryotinia globosa]|nr:hypothetical protein EAF00_009186 [Botryotinia globosa]